MTNTDKDKEKIEELQEELKVEKLRLSQLGKVLSQEKITEREAILALKSSKRAPGKKIALGIPGNHIRYGYFTDAHIGHEMFKEDLFQRMIRVFKKYKVDFIVDAGDHLEGMSGRPGHIYELTHIGFSQQMQYAAQLYNALPAMTYGIDGNHDEWYAKKNNGGVIVGEGLESRVKNYRHLGQGEADLEVAPGIVLKLFHANDGTAYATSYKLQKLIESFSEDERPSIVHSGHYHKALYMFLRGVHGFESGTLMGQSKWMRGKKIAAHMGFGVVDLYSGKNRGVEKLVHSFYAYDPVKPAAHRLEEHRQEK